MVAPASCAGAVDDAAVDEAAEDEAGEHQQRRDDEGVVDLVDVELVFDEAIERGDAVGECGGGAGLLVVEDVGDVEAEERGEDGDGGKRRVRGRGWLRWRLSQRRCVEDRLEEVFDLVAVRRRQRECRPIRR